MQCFLVFMLLLLNIKIVYSEFFQGNLFSGAAKKEVGTCFPSSGFKDVPLQVKDIWDGMCLMVSGTFSDKTGVQLEMWDMHSFTPDTELRLFWEYAVKLGLC